MLRTLASRAFRFSLAALLAVAALAAAPALRAQDEDLFGGDDKPAAAHGDAKNAAGGEEDKAGEEAVPGTYDAARGDLAARLDDLITTLSEANRTYSERVNKLLDQGEQELKRVREIAGSVQQQVSDAVDAVRALAETVKEFLLLSEDDMTSLVDDLSTSVLGDQLKGLVDLRAGTLTDVQKQDLKNAVDTPIV
ncbi:MAG: hypothetical protein HY719_08465, partial [Planctomycetes bacterium]|nr:hypothetical protein [Planctomycetota bacterium]